MIPKYTQEEFDNAKSKEKVLLLECEVCHHNFYMSKLVINRVLSNHSPNRCKYCSEKCSRKARKTNDTIQCNCFLCNKPIIRTSYELYHKQRINRDKVFCGRSCSAKYYNSHRKDHNVSKLERYLQSILVGRYPNMQFMFNGIDAIKSELDIYIPSLRLAFELNGPFHYEPIFGPEKLTKTQNNDQRKFAACIENNIALCVIDTSRQAKVTPKSSQQYVDIICTIIDRAIAES